MRIILVAAVVLPIIAQAQSRGPAPTEAYTGRLWHVIEEDRCVRLDTTAEGARDPEQIVRIAQAQGYGVELTYERSPTAGAGNLIAHIQGPGIEPIAVFPTFMSCRIALGIAREQAGLPPLPNQDPRDARSVAPAR